MRSYPFSAVVASEDMCLALILAAVSPEIGGVLVRGEKGTAKTTMVRALAALLPEVRVVEGCRFSCDPLDPDPGCPDGPHAGSHGTVRPARLVELPVGASEDRVIGSLDLRQALGAGHVTYDPGLLAAAHRGILYVDEVNLLHDHLVDLLLDAAAMGRSTVEREGVSVAHASRLVLIGTMNPEEGELRPQLLDRFGLTVEVAAPRDPNLRAEVIRRRLAYERDPDAFARQYAAADTVLGQRILAARSLLPSVRLAEDDLLAIARICAAFGVDGMRADIVTARAALAHASWHGRRTVEQEDLRAAARLALPHRRRRNPFDAPGLDEDLLDSLLEESRPEPEPPGEGPPGGSPSAPPPEAPAREGANPEPGPPAPPAANPPAGPPASRQSPPPTPTAPPGLPSTPSTSTDSATSSTGPGATYRTRVFTAAGMGRGEAGRRSRAVTSIGRVVGATSPRDAGDPDRGGSIHLPATLRRAAPHQPARGRPSGTPLRLAAHDLRLATREGRESNLVLLAVDASGSMAARRRMAAVKGAVLSLLLDAYQRRDKVGLITFRGGAADLALPPTWSVEIAARRLAELPSGGRTPLAEGLLCAADTLRRERLRDPRRRPLLVVVTDGRATAGTSPLARAYEVAGHLRATGLASLVVDCEEGALRFGLAGVLADRLGAAYVKLGELAADSLAGAVRERRVA